jgi:hypothetical protein
MAHFAQVKNGIVQHVIVADQEFIDSGALGDPSEWIQTSYNTRGGVHYNPETGEPSTDQSKALRKNYAGFGFVYDETRDAFYQAKPRTYNSWILNEESCVWEAPIAYPVDGNKYTWDETTTSWVLEQAPADTPGN